MSDEQSPTGPRSSKTVRKVRNAAVIGVLSGGMVLAGIWAWGAVTAPIDFGGDAVETPSASACTPQPSAASFATSDISLYVYNGTQLNGMATKAKSAFEAQGFKVLNYFRSGIKASGGTGTFIGSADQSDELEFASKWVPGSTIVTDDRTTDHIDFVVGPNFSSVTKPTEAKPADSCATAG